MPANATISISCQDAEGVSARVGTIPNQIPWHYISFTPCTGVTIILTGKDMEACTHAEAIYAALGAAIVDMRARLKVAVPEHM